MNHGLKKGFSSIFLFDYHNDISESEVGGF